MLDPNHVLAGKYPLRLKAEDFDQQGELHLELVRVEDLGREDRALQSDNGQVAALDSVNVNVVWDAFLALEAAEDDDGPEYFPPGPHILLQAAVAELDE